MSLKSILLYSLIFLLLTGFGASLALQSYTNLSVGALVSGDSRHTANSVATTFENCSKAPALPNLEASGDEYLVKLADFQRVCRSLPATKMMLFTGMPKDPTEAVTMATAMASHLKSFSTYKITPVVVMEPSASWGLVDFGEFNRGLYNDWLATYFATLRQQGITDSQMGIWVPFPEPNAPLWNRRNFVPEDFNQMISQYSSLLKGQFPAAKVSLLFNSTSYETDDEEYANGESMSFLPWIDQLPLGTVDSFGIQGFPWLPRAGSKAAGITQAAEFLSPQLLLEAAAKLGVKEVWFNTGTFYAKYTQNSADTIFVSPTQRKAIAQSIVTTVSQVQKQGVTVWVNIFAQDKSTTPEATDWSYWKNPQDVTDPHASVFIDLVHGLSQRGIGISLFDQTIQPN